MPSFCQNTLTLKNSDTSKMANILEVLKSEKGFFQALLPRPEEDEEDGYHWNLENWGTKWEADVNYWESDDQHSVFVDFDTAWSPPIYLYQFLHSKGWVVDAKYCFDGTVGEFVMGSENTFEYDFDDWEPEEIPNYLREFADLDEKYLDYKGR